MHRVTIRNLHGPINTLALKQSTSVRSATQRNVFSPHSVISNAAHSCPTVSGKRFNTTLNTGDRNVKILRSVLSQRARGLYLQNEICKRFSSSGTRGSEQEYKIKDIGNTPNHTIGSSGGSAGSYGLTSGLPTRVKMVLDTPGVFPRELAPRTNSEPSREIRQSFGTTYGGNYKLQWEDTPRTILIIKKQNDEQTDKALIDVASWIHSKYPQMNVVVEPDVAQEFSRQLPFLYTIPENKRDEYTRVTDLVVTLGGDGTILHTSALFNSAVPPVISFSMGTLGFLLPYHINNYQTAISKLIDTRQASLLLRMRLKCTLHGADGRRLQAKDGSGRINDLTVMNEVNLHRGRYPHLTWIGCYVDGHLITEAVADGLIVASPTGSTAYSLSAGGSIVHPSIQSLLLTPICPRSLSFRPVLLPPNATIQLKIGEKSRGPAEVSLDGKETFFLDKNEFLQVCMSAFPMPCVNRVHAGEDWIKDINDLLKWNQGFHNKQSMSHYMSE
ncbi:NADH kinase pos5 [Mortierella sp. AM989]|nr:NADH kinase pos5 [Mortierella sp. AM989]